ncbi:MAG: hypothetical protein OEY49_20190, partial [Candidatus Heimdallarchaeota archaeon]|nr:hypothetical protein [Candidatus Heimdallarchaeota archaeon]
ISNNYAIKSHPRQYLSEQPNNNNNNNSSSTPTNGSDGGNGLGNLPFSYIPGIISMTFVALVIRRKRS